MKKLALGMILLLGLGVAWRTVRPSDAPDAKLLFHRFWIDHEPRAPKEQFQVLFVNGEIPMGHFATRTMWTGVLEFFHYHIVPRQDGVIDFLFGNTNERQRVKYSARRCHERGFDYCLELGGTSRGVQRYYSKKAWDQETDENAFVAHLFQ